MTSRAAGFTLLEVLAAFTIMAIALGGLMQVFGTGLRGAADAGEHVKAVFIAQSLIDGLDRRRLPMSSRATGTSGRYLWELDIAPYLEADASNADELTGPAPLAPVAVRAIVRWGKPAHEVVLTTLRLGYADETLQSVR